MPFATESLQHAITWFKTWSLSDIADWASILSLGVTAYAVYSIKRVRAEIVARATLPSLVAALERHARTLAQLLSSPENLQQVRVELARCQANLRDTQRKVPRAPGGRVRLLVAKIAEYEHVDDHDYQVAWSVYADLNGVVQELRNFVIEQRVAR